MILTSKQLYLQDKNRFINKNTINIYGKHFHVIYR